MKKILDLLKKLPNLKTEKINTVNDLGFAGCIGHSYEVRVGSRVYCMEDKKCYIKQDGVQKYVQCTNKDFTLILLRIISMNKMRKSVVSLERHAYAPELNRLHLLGGVSIKTPQAITIDAAIALAVRKNEDLGL
tara:strand:+ start:383 stop:784 length:402 start_codon:yes stop_codon:yes gene_type:complete